MKEELIDFIKRNNISIYESISLSNYQNPIFKTKDAKQISTKVISKLSENFVFFNTRYLLNFIGSFSDLNKKQNFFNSLNLLENDFLKKLEKPKSSWRPKYDVVIVTEDENTLVKLKELNCPVIFLSSESDLNGLDKYDIVQVVDCENFSYALERLPQSIFLNSLNEAYLERHLIKLSSWKNNLDLLSSQNLSQDLSKLVLDLKDLLSIMSEKGTKIIKREEIEDALQNINNNLLSEIKKLTISGESLISILSKGIPKDIMQIIEKEIKNSGINEELFEISIPLKIDEKETESYLKRQSTNEFTNFSAIIKKNAEKIKNIPKKISELETELIYFDLISGISKFSKDKNNFPEISENFEITNSRNLFIDNPQPISFMLSKDTRCSILTGANSGGKTTLLEHLIQLVTLSQLGLPVSGQVKNPFFTDVYYFAKNKGSMMKGAFETLLTQMSEIKPGEKTLILADEIEAVTEPGVAGEVIVATAEYFLEKNCFLVIATHLGKEIQPILPKNSRVDGIEAKGLTETFELIVDHNPVLGRLAHSTPELIIEKMAKSTNKDYFLKLHEKLKK